jgi:hypothetical protein
VTERKAEPSVVSINSVMFAGAMIAESFTGHVLVIHVHATDAQIARLVAVMREEDTD